MNIYIYIWRLSDVTYNPHMNDARRGPLFITMYVATSRFSPPRSPRTREGMPYSVAADLKSSSTVADLLLSLARKAVTCEAA